MRLTERILSFTLLGSEWVLWLLIALSVVSVAVMVERGFTLSASGKFDFEAVNEAFFCAVGTPDQVVDQLSQWGETMGTNHFNLMAAVGNMPN